MAQARSGRGKVSGKLKKPGSKKVSSGTYVTVNRGTKRVKVKASDTKGHRHQAKHATRRAGRGTLTAPSSKSSAKRKSASAQRSGRGNVSGSLTRGSKKVSSGAYVTVNRGTKTVKAGSIPKGRKVNRRNLRRKSGRM